MSSVVEPEKRVPVVYDVDVAVAGGGVSGIFAALAAARNGVETVLIDRFGTVGGNIGPGMIIGGSLTGGTPHVKAGYCTAVFGGITGIPKEFIERYGSLGGGCLPPYNNQINYPKDSNIASYLALKMLEESNVKLMLSTCVADPILEGTGSAAYSLRTNLEDRLSKPES